VTGADPIGPTCPLCATAAERPVAAAGRPLWACPECGLRFVPADHHLSLEQERQRYLLHRNSRADDGYVRFLMNAVDALRRHAGSPPGLDVLDYGSGPTAVLADLLREAGFRVTAFDPFFAPDADLSRPFDAVVSTETFEHFRRPREDVARVVALVKPGGLLVVMTALHDGVADWGRWHYALDSTHVAFYSARTFAYIAREWGLCIREQNGRNLVVLERLG
jgi:SAM-dependent methyltransferase